MGPTLSGPAHSPFFFVEGEGEQALFPPHIIKRGGVGMGKDYWKSKTLWFNVLTLAVIIAEAFGYVDFVPNEDIAEYATALVTIINVILRIVTKEPIKFR